MKKSIQFYTVVAAGLLALAALVFFAVYTDRFKTIASIEQITDYTDGFNLYCMDVQYGYDLDDILAYGITADQSNLDAILKAALPLLPVHMEAPDFGCSAFALQGEDGEVMMGRNYDFRYDTSAMLVYCAPKDGYKSVAFAALDNLNANVADASLASKLACLAAPFVCLDGMNEKGVSIAVLTLDCEPTRQNTGKPVISTTLAIRLILDKAATTVEAIELLNRYDMFAASGRDYHFYITDASGDGRIVEYDCESDGRELVATPTRSVTNFLIMYKEKVTKPGKNGVYGHGLERYEAMEEIFDTAARKNRETAWNALMAAAQEPSGEVTGNTQWSVVFHNTDLTAEFVLHRKWNDVVYYNLKTNTITLSE